MQLEATTTAVVAVRITLALTLPALQQTIKKLLLF